MKISVKMWWAAKPLFWRLQIINNASFIHIICILKHRSHHMFSVSFGACIACLSGIALASCHVGTCHQQWLSYDRIVPYNYRIGVLGAVDLLNRTDSHVREVVLVLTLLSYHEPTHCNQRMVLSCFFMPCNPMHHCISTYVGFKTHHDCMLQQSFLPKADGLFIKARRERVKLRLPVSTLWVNALLDTIA